MAPESSPKGALPLSHSTHVFSVPSRDVHDKADSGRGWARPASPPQHTGSPEKPIRIPKITPVPETLVNGLEGKYVDEFGNVLDWDGTVLGRVHGDLPSMIGRPVSASGEVLDVGGDVVGHVAENQVRPAAPVMRSLGMGLKADPAGTIFDETGSVVGKLNGQPWKEGGAALHAAEPPEERKNGKVGANAARGASGPSSSSATPSPSEIYLDVKSTHDGIQIILKIPTVFKNEGDGSQLHVSPSY